MRGRGVTVAGIAAVAVSLGLVVWVTTRPDFAVPPGVQGPGPRWHNLVPPIAWTVTGAVLLWLRPRNTVGRLMMFVGVCQSMAQAASAYGMYGVGVAQPPWPAARWIAFFGAPLWVPGFLPLFTVLPAIYPDGRLPGPRWRLPVAATWVGIAFLTLLLTGGYHDIAPGPLPVNLAAPLPVRIIASVTTATLILGGAIGIWVLTAVRLARSGQPERQLLAWLLCALIPVLALSFLSGTGLVTSLLSIALPVAVAVGVLRYRLLGIEVVLRRGLVYVVLTAVVVAIYLAVTALVSSRLDFGAVPGVLAAGAVAVGLTPLRERVQGLVDRLVYGDRRDPVRAVTRFADGLASTGEVEDLLPTVLTTVMGAVRAPGAAVLGPDDLVLAVRGADGDGISLPLTFGGHAVGTLRIAARTFGERYTEGDRRLLTALAPQVAAVVRALALAEALESARDRVVAATRTERDRLRRELHDGLGPSLSGIGLGLQALETASTVGDGKAVTEILARVRAETGAAVTEVRRILEGLRPSAVDELGLAGAVRRHAHTIAAHVPVILDVPSKLPVLSYDVETAAFRIAQEALTNVVRHAKARNARLALRSADGSLHVEVADDGHGFGPDDDPGVGMGSMRHRAEVLGGTLDVTTGASGTRIVATLPVRTQP